MIDAVLDANIIIDLLKTNLFKSFLKLQWNYLVTDLVLNEIQERGIELSNFSNDSLTAR